MREYELLQDIIEPKRRIAHGAIFKQSSASYVFDGYYLDVSLVENSPEWFRLMNTEESSKRKGMKHGLYRIFWKDGGSSLASVGYTHDGTNWYAPCNWTSVNNIEPIVASTNWEVVSRAELIQENNYNTEESSKPLTNDELIALLRDCVSATWGNHSLDKTQELFDNFLRERKLSPLAGFNKFVTQKVNEILLGSKPFVWTDELVKDYVAEEVHRVLRKEHTLMCDTMEEFKNRKVSIPAGEGTPISVGRSEGKDWEIVEVKCKYLGSNDVRFSRANDGSYNTGLNGRVYTETIERLIANGTIISVKRKSDGEVFSVGDWVTYAPIGIVCWEIDHFFISTDGERISARSKNYANVEFIDKHLRKMPKPQPQQESKRTVRVLPFDEYVEGKYLGYYVIEPDGPISENDLQEIKSYIEKKLNNKQ